MTEPSRNRIGQQLGNYEITQFLGRGGFADVFLGRNVNLPAQEVAIKILDKIMIRYDKVDQFKNEATIILTLRHPSIVQFYNYDVYFNPTMTDTAYPYIVMEYAAKGSLRNKHPRGVSLPLETIVIYVRQIASALHYAHGSQVLHLDIKPENILVNQQGKLLLSDFGLATVINQQRHSPDIQGTLSYMAPEQFENRNDKASDQYSLAVMVYEWICGSVPFVGRTIEDHVQKLLYEPPPSLTARVPTLDAAVETVVMRALAKNTRDRYASVLQFAEHLEKAINNPKQISPVPKSPAIVLPVQAPPLINQEKLVQAPTPLASIEKPKQPEDPGLLLVASPSVGEKDYSMALDPQLATNFERYEEHLAYYGLSMQEPANWDDPDLDFPIPLRLAAIQTDQNALQLFIDKNMAHYRTYLNKFETMPNSLNVFTTCRHCFAVRYGQRALGTLADQILQWPKVLHQLLAQVRYPDLRRLIQEDITLTPAVPLANQAVNQPLVSPDVQHVGGPAPANPAMVVPQGSPFYHVAPPRMHEADKPDPQALPLVPGAPQPPTALNASDSTQVPWVATPGIISGQSGTPSEVTKSPFLDSRPQQAQTMSNQQQGAGGVGPANRTSPFLGSSSPADQHKIDPGQLRFGPIPESPDQTYSPTIRVYNIMDEPAPPAIPPYLGRPGNGGALNRPEESSVQDFFSQTMQDLIQPRRGRRRASASPLFVIFIAASFIGAIYFAVWLGRVLPSTANEAAWVGLILTFFISLVMFKLFDYSGNTLVKVVAAILLAIDWGLFGYAFADVIGGGTRIGILPGPSIMATIFLFGTLGLCFWKMYRQR